MKQAKLFASNHFIVGEINENLFGSFVEHMGRTIYTGIYEPTHPSADEDGFRSDTLEAVKGLGLKNIRYPGGNFVSCYNWKDGVGKERIPRLEIAWGATEPNTFGLNEFMKFAEKVNVMPIIAVNLGTRGIEDAMSLVEYCNHSGGTYYSDLRIEHGITEPYNIATWCLGNEMDGPWQIGHKTATEYGRLAEECAKAMKRVDPRIKLVSCGSSLSSMSTYPDWELTTLGHTYDYIDYISLHQYYGGQDKGTPEFLSQSENMDKYIRTVAAVCNVIKEKKRSDRDIYISFDEWNVWNFPSVKEPDAAEKWQVAPRTSEMIYTFEDMLLFSSMMLVLLRNCDRVKIACQSLLTNVSATIMTVPGGECWLQPTYYPFSHIAKYAKGKVLNTNLICPTYASENGEIPYLDVICVQDPDNKELVIFAVNRSLTDDFNLEVDLYGLHPKTIQHQVKMKSDDIKANNLENHKRIVPAYDDKKIAVNEQCELPIPKFSWNVFRIQYDQA